jgi:hypothetical protein
MCDTCLLDTFSWHVCCHLFSVEYMFTILTFPIMWQYFQEMNLTYTHQALQLSDPCSPWITVTQTISCFHGWGWFRVLYSVQSILVALVESNEKLQRAVVCDVAPLFVFTCWCIVYLWCVLYIWRETLYAYISHHSTCAAGRAPYDYDSQHSAFFAAGALFEFVARPTNHVLRHASYITPPCSH